MFWHNFSILCAGMGKSPNAVGKELGIPSGSITAWRKGSIPRGATIKKIADYFGVTVGYLLDGEEKEKPAPTNGDGTSDWTSVLTRDELERISAAMAEMNEEGRERAVEMVEDLAAGGRFKKHREDAMDKEA